MLRQYGQIKAQYPDAILMFRLGDFYEMFFDDAVDAAKILDITLTSRNKNDTNPIPLCGVPYHSVEPYVAKLLENGKKVAICEQVEDPKQAKGVVRRDVTRVLTPGVVPDGLGLSGSSHNFLAGVVAAHGRFGLCLTDASTGLLQALEVESGLALLEELSRSEPKEILIATLPEAPFPLTPEIERRFEGILISEQHVEVSPILEGHLVRLEGGKALEEKAPGAALAAMAVLQYLHQTQLGRLDQITRVQYLGALQSMRLDDATRRNLELTRNLQDGSRTGSLLQTLDRTSTAPGARLLKQWILYPLVNLEEIHARLGAVKAVVETPTLLARLPEVLSQVYDLERITSRIILGSAHARDLVALKDSLRAAADVRKMIENGSGDLARLARQIDPCFEIAAEVERSIVDEPPLTLREGGIIRAGVHAELDSVRDAADRGKEIIAQIEQHERAATGINSLKVRYNKVFGYYLEVTSSNLSKVPQHYIRKQTLANAERYVTPELKEHEERVLGASERSRALEYELFTVLRERIAREHVRLMRTAEALAAVDVIVALARNAAEYGYVQPEVHAGREIEIVEGRHVVVERADPSVRFVGNDVRLAGDAPDLMMITGPNMAGKSTVMRQTALIQLMAQMGSFVPAKSARIGIADRIFTRVGASDAIASGQSTFMVEMSEAATILNAATERSLVIVDEIGRGTSTFDGLAIAWAVAEDLHDRVRSRTMFATHYHELTELAVTRPRIGNFHVAVREWNGQVIFLRRLVPGATSRSYGIAVAALAGLPEGVIARAREVLENLEQGEFDERGEPRLASHHTPAETLQLRGGEQFQLFSPNVKWAEIEQRLRTLDVTAMTPIEAMNILHEISKSVQ